MDYCLATLARIPRAEADRDIRILKRFRKCFGKRRLSTITAKNIEDYKTGRASQVKPSTVNRELACLKHLFNLAICWGKAKANPVRQVRFFRQPEGRLWEDQGLGKIIKRLGAEHKFGFEPERVAFAMALQRLCLPGRGSDLQGSDWVETVEAEGFERIALQHLYRTTGFLAEVREALEEQIFYRDRDLFTQQLDLVFIDTTSLLIYRREETEWRRRGYSRDHRPDLPQLVLAVVVDQNGWPVSWEVFPGDTADKHVFEAVVRKLRERFRIRRVIVVGDRGMMSKGAIEMLVKHPRAPYQYILGCRMRRQKEVAEEVLGRGGRYLKVSAKLKVKEVKVHGRRYIVCLNEEEARKDAATRESILKRLQEVLAKKGPKSLVGNKGFSRFLRIERGSMRIDQRAIEADARLDGKFVLRTKTRISHLREGLFRKSIERQ